jgi:predicted signal transduction protein with EAL and GGDEF domain
VLLEIAARLSATLAADDLLARTGGDEFAVLVAGTDPAGVTDRADAALLTLRTPMNVGDHTLHVTASIGVRADDDTAGPVHLLSDADLALYAAKARGKDCLVRYEAAIRDRQTHRLRTVERLRHALQTGEFAVHYQPIVDLATSRPIAVEALVRWLPPGQRPVGPDVFIPAAEDSGLIIPLGEWVLHRACADAAAWHQRFGVAVTVNVSPRQLTDEHFTAKVRRSLQDSGLPPTALTLEITEGILVGAGQQRVQALAHLENLRADGIRISIDDFGTGSTSPAAST